MLTAGSLAQINLVASYPLQGVIFARKPQPGQTFLSVGET